MIHQSNLGILLLNLGSPDDPSTGKVRTYLREFLSDPRVLDLPALGRLLLLYGIILPFRPRKSAEAYQKIWTDAGSPLIQHSKTLTDCVATKLGTKAMVRFAMRYQHPSLKQTLLEMRDAGVENLVVFPLYPQYASSSTGSSLEAVYRICGSFWNTPNLRIVPAYYAHPAFINAVSAVTRRHLKRIGHVDKLVFSFHGLPERHITKSRLPDSTTCLLKDDCCSAMKPDNRFCYRAQCYATARLMAEQLNVSPQAYEVCFQSRLGRTPWIKPYTDVRIEELAKSGLRKLAVVCPSFSADCLETLEEIGIRAKESFIENGGKDLQLIPCVNAEPEWLEAVLIMIEEQLAGLL